MIYTLADVINVKDHLNYKLYNKKGEKMNKRETKNNALPTSNLLTVWEL